MKLHRVFVYGTLKRGIHNHRLLDGSDFLGEAYTVDTFKMFTTGFPVIFPDYEGKSVYGEVYDVDDVTLKRLDQLESEGHMYDRKTVNVILDQNNQGRVIDANVSIYVGNAKYWENHNLPVYDVVNGHDEIVWAPRRKREAVSAVL